MYQVHYQSLRPVATAHLAQTMTLLSLTTDELRQQIEAELASNPALELVEERRCPMCKRKLGDGERCPVCSKPEGISEEPVVFLSPRDDFIPKSDVVKDESQTEYTSAHIDDLPTFVLRQIAPDLDTEQQRLAAYLLTNLDEDGLLTTTVYEVARYFHLQIEKVNEIKRIIQRAEPIGVGSNSPEEALLVQLEVLAENQAVPVEAEIIIKDALQLLSRRQYSDIAKKIGCSVKVVKSCAKFISENLNPYPARSHWGDARQNYDIQQHVYRQPDIIINYLNDNPENPLVVEVILPIGGTLRVNPLFREAIRQVQSEKKELWKKDLESALLLVKCLQQRSHTMLRLVQKVVAIQRDFILFGPKFLQPMTRAKISKDLEVHESTISRAVANKAVQLPNGRIIPFSSFFSRNLNVRTVLRDIIENESQPLSDTALTSILAAQGYNVARRTVAKYRAMEGILPAHLRRAQSQTV